LLLRTIVVESDATMSVRRKKILNAICAVLAVGALIAAAPSMVGASAAGIDLLRGKPEYRLYGELIPTSRPGAKH
jgi:hypothetical protein